MQKILTPILLFLFILMPAADAVAAGDGMQTPAKQAIVMDYDTGTVLLAKNAHERMPTSSMSKLITTMVIFDAIRSGRMKLDDTLLVSEKAWRKGGSKMFVEVDKRVKVEDLIRGVIIQSGNDATIVLAEGLSGSEDAFADLLNKKAQDLGMKNSHFANASGWPDPDHYSTAADLAILARAVIHDDPEYYPYYAERDFTYNGITQPNRNPLLYRNIGADGIKTGHTEAGGYGLIGSGTYEGRRVIIVVNGLDSEKARAQESARLLEWGLKNFQNKTVFKDGETVEQAEVVLGKSRQVPLVLKEPLTLTLTKGPSHGWAMRVRYNTPLVAPLTKGQQAGTLEIEIPGLYKIEKPLLVGEDVAELGFFQRALAKMFMVLRGA